MDTRQATVVSVCFSDALSSSSYLQEKHTSTTKIRIKRLLIFIPLSSDRILCNIFLGDYKDFYGGFGVFGLKSDQILSKWRLMGPVWWKKCSSLIPPIIKSAQMIFFGGLFPPFHFH